MPEPRIDIKYEYRQDGSVRSVHIFRNGPSGEILGDYHLDYDRNGEVRMLSHDDYMHPEEEHYVYYRKDGTIEHTADAHGNLTYYREDGKTVEYTLDQQSGCRIYYREDGTVSHVVDRVNRRTDYDPDGHIRNTDERGDVAGRMKTDAQRALSSEKPTNTLLELEPKTEEHQRESAKVENVSTTTPIQPIISGRGGRD